MLRKKLQQAPGAHLLAEHLADLPGSLKGDSLDFGKLFRFILNDGKGVLSKLLDNIPGGDLAHPLYRPGGQIVEDFLQPLGQAALHQLGPHLRAVGGVAGPATPDGQILPRRHSGYGPHHCNLLTMDVQLEDGVAVLLILKNHSRDGALQQLQLLI